jgi:hypothetical protein
MAPDPSDYSRWSRCPDRSRSVYPRVLVANVCGSDLSDFVRWLSLAADAPVGVGVEVCSSTGTMLIAVLFKKVASDLMLFPVARQCCHLLEAASKFTLKKLAHVKFCLESEFGAGAGQEVHHL